jgi:segregation and condensation protein A
MYAVKVNQFEGPMDLLLNLIEKRKLFINDISLSEITDQYFEHLNKIENFPMEEIASFCVIASTLMLIKSCSLMPFFELTKEEEHSIEELEKRLKIYSQIRQLSLGLKKLFGKNPLFSREAFNGLQIGFIEPRGISAINLCKILKEIIKNLPVSECLPEANVKKIISMEEKTKELLEKIQSKFEFYFSELLSSKEDKKTEIIISFLAILELVKRGIIIVNQVSLFENIKICSVKNKNYDKS